MMASCASGSTYAGAASSRARQRTPSKASTTSAISSRNNVSNNHSSGNSGNRRYDRPVGLRARRQVAVASSSSSSSSGGSGVSGWDLSEAPEGLILSLAKELQAEWTQLPNARDAPCAPELKSVDATAPDGRAGLYKMNAVYP
jgi:hypothetical protein